MPIIDHSIFLEIAEIFLITLLMLMLRAEGTVEETFTPLAAATHERDPQYNACNHGSLLLPMSALQKMRTNIWAIRCDIGLYLVVDHLHIAIGWNKGMESWRASGLWFGL